MDDDKTPSDGESDEYMPLEEVGRGPVENMETTEAIMVDDGMRGGEEEGEENSEHRPEEEEEDEKEEEAAEEAEVEEAEEKRKKRLDGGGRGNMVNGLVAAMGKLLREKVFQPENTKTLIIVGMLLIGIFRQRRPGDKSSSDDKAAVVAAARKKKEKARREARPTVLTDFIGVEEYRSLTLAIDQVLDQEDERSFERLGQEVEGDMDELKAPSELVFLASRLIARGLLRPQDTIACRLVSKGAMLGGFSIDGWLEDSVPPGSAVCFVSLVPHRMVSKDVEVLCPIGSVVRMLLGLRLEAETPSGEWIGVAFFGIPGAERPEVKRSKSVARKERKKASKKLAKVSKRKTAEPRDDGIKADEFNEDEQYKSAPVQVDVAEGDESALDPYVLPSIELEHVKKVYDNIAEHWHGTRYKSWPKVAEFIQSLPEGSLVGDLGCGNGKNMPECNTKGFCMGSDISAPLVEICARNGLESGVADALVLPYRDGVFDAVLSIAVLHHLSSNARRVRAIEEVGRVLRPGGKALIYAWAQEQHDARSKHRFASQDVLVPWHHRDAESYSKKGDDIFAKVYQRYCHVYKSGDLAALVAQAGNGSLFHLESEYYDTGNWCCILTRLPPLPVSLPTE